MGWGVDCGVSAVHSLWVSCVITQSIPLYGYAGSVQSYSHVFSIWQMSLLYCLCYTQANIYHYFQGYGIIVGVIVRLLYIIALIYSNNNF